MANYHQVKNAAILTPTTNQDLGSDSNRYSNVFMSGNIIMSNGVTVTSTNVITPKISLVSYPGNDTAADIAGGQTLTISGSGFSSGATVLIGGSPVAITTVVSSTSITFTSPASSAGNYALYVVNTDGGTAIYIPGVAYSGTPTWTTSAGSLATVYETTSISNTVTATGDATISYSLASGTLPTGSSLNTSSGLISGTAPASAGSTTYTFTIRATDGQNQDTDRSFSITVNTDSVSWSSPADNTSTALSVNSAMANVTLSATSAAGKSITYSANALPTGLSISGANVIGTPTVVSSTTSLITATAASSGRTATRTLSWVVSVGTDTYWPYVTLLLNGEGAAATDNAKNSTIVDSSSNAHTVTVKGGTYQGTFSPFSAGGWSNYFDANGHYLSIPHNTALDLWVGNFTIECWVFSNANQDNYDGIITKGGGSDAGWQMVIVSNAVNVEINGSTLFFSPSTTLPNNTWVHLAIVKSGTNVSLFQNGTRISAITGSSSTYSTTNNVYIGADRAGGNFFNGYISNVRLVKGTAVYDPTLTTLTVPTASLTAIANTSLLTCQSNRLVDNSSNAFVVSRSAGGGNTWPTKFSPFSGTTYSPSAHVGGIVFIDSVDALNIPTNAAFDFGTGDFTFEFWMWLPATGASGDGAFLSGSASGSFDFVWYQSTLRFGRNGIAWDTTSTAFNPVLQQWYHIAFVKTSGTAKIFVNGVQTASAANSNTYGSQGGTVYFGSSQDGSRIFSGIMSNIRVVKGTAVYTTTFTPPTTPVTAISGTSLLLNGTNAGIIDQTGINNVKIGGDAKISTAVKKYNSGSIYFDGTGDYLAIPNDPLHAQLGKLDFTLELWFYQTVLNARDNYLISHRVSGYAPFLFWINSAGSLRSFASTSLGSWDTMNDTALGSISINTWYHLAYTRSGSTFKIFLNGTQVYTFASSATFTTTSNTLNIGGQAGGTDNFTGYVDDIRFTRGVARYTSNFTAPTSALLTS